MWGWGGGGVDADFNQICMDITFGHGEELVSF